VPYPESREQFWKLVPLGTKLRKLHLMQDESLQISATYPREGTNVIEYIKRDGERVIISAEQYFAGVPDVAWNFYIGGYQPAQKYLKDRKGIVLTYDEIEQYRKIVATLVETDRVMKEIDEVN
jgi:hypothetical protein